jgi:hypothetical protein
VLALVRNASDTTWQIAARVIDSTAPHAADVQVQPWLVLHWDATAGAFAEAAVPSGVRLLPIAPLLASAGFYPAPALARPTSRDDIAWTRLTNLTGMRRGVTALGSELSLLYGASELARSAFAASLGQVWNGAHFV